MPKHGKNRAGRGKGLVRIEYPLLKSAILNLGLSETAFARKVDISTHTMDRIRRGDGVRPCVLKVLADYLKIRPTDLLADAQAWNGTPCTSPDHSHHREWAVDEVIVDWMESVGGLRSKIVRLKHRELPERFARGKCYQLDKLATKEDQRVRELLLRHPRICLRFRGHPQIPLNLGVFQENSGKTWWVIDEWVPGRTLATILRVGPLPEVALAIVTKQIAEGIRALHGAAIIRRELAPWNVIIQHDRTLAVLTDFEQSKLLDSSATVSPVWKEDPYRAPEVETSTSLDGRADLYSWGRIFVHAACGRLPTQGKEAEELDRLSLPSRVRDIVKRCVGLPFDERPGNIENVLTALSQWAIGG